MKKNDSLKKHHFWILAGLAPLLALLTMVFLMTGPGEAKDKAAGEIEAKKKEATSTQPKGKGVLEKDFPKQKDELLKRREILWKANYEAQKGIFGWPQSPRLADLEKRYTKFGAKMETNHNLAFDDFKNRDIYETAYDRVAEEVKPTVFRGGNWRRVLRHVNNWTERYPTSDQVWLALEDLWVQRGLLLPIKEVNAEAARFDLVRAAGPDGKPADPSPLKRTFRNRVWELELEVPTTGPHANKAILAKLKNRTNRIQLLGTNNEMRLNVWLSENAPGPMRYRIQKDFAKANEEIKVETPIPVLHGIPKDVEVQAITRVEQVLDERTVPVRQVLNVELGYKDARHHQAALKKPEWWPEAAVVAPADGMSGEPGGMPGGPPGGMPGGEPGSPDGGLGGRFAGMMPGGMGGVQAAKAGPPAAVLDRNKDRYVDVTKQVRRMPVAVVLLVDQMFVQDALVAYANSPLRFQITQYHWKRFRGSLSSATGSGMGFPFGGGDPGAGEEFGSPDGGDTGAGSPDGGGSGYVLPGRGGMPGMMPGGMPGGEGGYGGYGGFGMPGSGTTGSISEGQITSGLVELTLYGIVTLYEKYETQPADGTTPGTTPTAGATDAAQPATGGTTTKAGEATTPAADPKTGTATTPAPMTNPMTPPATPPDGTTPGAAPPATPPKM